MRSSLGFGLALLTCVALHRAEAAPTTGPAAPSSATAPGAGSTASPAVSPAASPTVSPQAPSPASPVAAKVESPAPAVPAAVTVSQDPRPTLDPSTFVNTMRAASAYRRIAEAGPWPVFPAGTVLKVGDRGPHVLALRKRLAAEGDLAGERIQGDGFDTELAAAVKRFQARHGLFESGAVRAKTLEALNVPALVRHRQLAASARRLMGSTFAFGERYVVVNIPSATVEAVESGAVVRRYVAVVGKADRPSPTVETRVTAINLNPTWTVPVSLIKKDIIPKMRSDPAYLAKMKIRILDGRGQEVDPQTVDWSTQSAVNYTLRQDPGATNSLGQVRIDMPNREAVYMHDTPTKRLFAQDTRFHSSGCVRVADVTAFSEWLLRGTAGPGGPMTRASIETAIGTGGRRDIRLDKPVPVAWVYLTGYATPDGQVHFRNDVYGLDEPRPDPLIEADALDPPATSSIATRPVR